MSNDETQAVLDGLLSWEEYFMGVAVLSARRSKDPRTKVGTCIVNEQRRIVAIGYNGMPNHCSDEEFPWGDKADNELDTKYLYVVHAELNAILNSVDDLTGCTLYTALFPCNECCKAIIQSGIKHVVYLSDKYADTESVIASKRMFGAAEVSFQEYSGRRGTISICIEA